MVWCRFGTTDSELPQLAACPRQVDFMFHDCGHSREDCVNDFNQTIRILAPGAVVLFDDIRWEEQRFSAQKAHTYEGWREVVANPSVARAVEIDDVLGLLLMR
jgi:predicted O-methyltransferase YrrM